MNEQKWEIYPLHPQCEVLSRAIKIPYWVARVLTNRRITSPQEANAFLFGDESYFHDPFLFRDMKKAVSRIQRAIEKKEKILVFGDYDVDGILSVVMLTRALADLGAEVAYHIPNRLQEGYGLKESSLEMVLKEGANLVISADCGITATDFVHRARLKGIDVIITDHHQPGPQLPAAVAILNPALADSGYPENNLASVGVIFKLIQALYTNHPRESRVLHYLKLVSIGTVADIVELKGENRFFVKRGLEQLKQAVNPGLKSLLDICGLLGKNVSVWDVGFRIGPRINAAGRLGEAQTAVELFFSADDERVNNLVRKLDDFNYTRQKIEEKIFNQAVKKIEEEGLAERKKVLILGEEGWHRGVIGIVASKLKELYYRPVIVFAFEDERAVGSGRSIPGFSLIDCLHAQRDLLENYGGHTQAAGCELRLENLRDFETRINDYADNLLGPEDLVKKIYIDAEVDLEEIDAQFMEYFHLLAPFGVGNPRPYFLSSRAELIAPPQKLQGKHSKIIVKQKNRAFEAIGWQQGEWSDCLRRGDLVDLVFTPQTNNYRGGQQVYLSLLGIKKV